MLFRSLVRHRADPVDESGTEQAADAPQQDRVRAVAADVVLHAARERPVYHAAIDRIEHDHRVVLPAQASRLVDPVALPATLAQLLADFVLVVTALAAFDPAPPPQRARARVGLPR